MSESMRPRGERWSVPDPGPGAPERVGDVLTGVLGALGLTEALARQGAIVRWREVVGERIAHVAKAITVSSDVLFVQVDSSAWLSELSLMKQDILRRLNAGQKEGRIEKIVFTLSERSGKGS
ncbi:MAG: DUF721 domain-containing protein [Gemmatimonadetes bacterium]|nr:DUF721 domain-containing protein [Gemmatimonadota bacterium]